MNEKNTMKLFQDFPGLYREVRDAQHGFECGDGWYGLIHQLSESIEAQARKLGLDPYADEWPRALQVKEKFGTLRFYVATPSYEGERGLGFESNGGMISVRPVAGIQSIRELVSCAEAKSAELCEQCGAPGELVKNGGWWRTTCSACEAKGHDQGASNDCVSGF